MGLFWDLIQQNQIGEQRARTSSLDSRVNALEREMLETRRLLQALMQRLEEHFGEDLDRDGRIG